MELFAAKGFSQGPITRLGVGKAEGSGKCPDDAAEAHRIAKLGLGFGRCGYCAGVPEVELPGWLIQALQAGSDPGNEVGILISASQVLHPCWVVWCLGG